MGGLSCTEDWSSQLIGSEITDEATLALKFNEFLGSLTAHFRPLEPLFTGIWAGACAPVYLRAYSV